MSGWAPQFQPCYQTCDQNFENLKVGCLSVESVLFVSISFNIGNGFATFSWASIKASYLILGNFFSNYSCPHSSILFQPPRFKQEGIENHCYQFLITCLYSFVFRIMVWYRPQYCLLTYMASGNRSHDELSREDP